jgi:hypothetical protein
MPYISINAENSYTIAKAGDGYIIFKTPRTFANEDIPVSEIYTVRTMYEAYCKIDNLLNPAILSPEESQPVEDYRIYTQPPTVPPLLTPSTVSREASRVFCSDVPTVNPCAEVGMYQAAQASVLSSDLGLVEECNGIVRTGQGGTPHSSFGTFTGTNRDLW